MRLWAVVLVGIVAVGCGDDDAPPDGDAGASDAFTDAASPTGWTVAPPAPAAPPDIACAAGWRAVMDEDGTHCDPWPEAGRATCGDDEIHLPGTPGCAPIGAPCPAGDYSTALPSDRPVLYVLAGATGGDGSEPSPLGTIGQALTMAGTTTAVAIGRGTYDEELRPRAGTALYGTCVAATRLTASGVMSAPVVSVRAGDVEIHDLAIADSDRLGLQALGGSVSATLRGVLLTRLQNSAVRVGNGARLDAEGVAIREIETTPSGDSGFGVIVEMGASARIVRAAIEGYRIAGVAVQAAGPTELEDVVVYDGRSRRTDGGLGVGLAATDASDVQTRRVVFEETSGGGLFAVDLGTDVALQDAVIRDTRPNGSLLFGRAVDVEGLATGSCTRCTFERNRDVAVYSQDDGARVRLTDVLVRDVAPRMLDDRGGRGIETIMNASAELRRVRVARARDAAVFTTMAASLDAEDLTVTDTVARSDDGRTGFGLSTQLGARAVVRRGRFERNRFVAVAAVVSTMTLEDVAIVDTLGREDTLAHGRGIDQEGAGELVLERVLVERARDVGVFVSVDVQATIEDLLIRDILPDDSDLSGGRGLGVQFDSVATIDRMRIEDVYDVGLTVIDASEQSLMTRVEIRNVREQACAGTTCAETAAGTAASIAGAPVSLTEFSIDGADTCGVQLSLNGAADLASGEVSGCAIGACVQVDGYDFSRLTNDVFYRDNGINLDATMLPVPAPGAMLTPP